jgi:hypothetical protein
MASILPKALILAPFHPPELGRLKKRLEVFYESRTDTRKLFSPEELIERIREQVISILVVEADFVFDEVFEGANANALVRSGNWIDPAGPYISMRGTELAGRTAGIIGLGAIGLEVAKRLRAFDMEILASDPCMNAPGNERVYK